MRPVLAALLVLAGADDQVLKLDMTTMKDTLIRNDKVVLLLHSGACSRAAEFAPTLSKIAASFTNDLAFGTFDVVSDTMVKPEFAKGILPEAPALKALFKNGPPGKRLLEYRGPPSHEAVFAWVKAVAAWDGSEQLPEGWEVPRKDQQDPSRNKDET